MIAKELLEKMGVDDFLRVFQSGFQWSVLEVQVGFNDNDMIQGDMGGSFWEKDLARVGKFKSF